MIAPHAVRSPSTPTGRDWHFRLSLVETVFGIFPPFTLARTRRLAHRAAGIRAGHATLFWGIAKLRGPGAITSRLTIGDWCGFNDGCEFDLTAPITIRNHVSVGHEVRFLTREGVENAAPITIEDGAWLGARCTILGGVTVGAGCVIGAGVTVDKDVPANTLMTGAKPVSLAKWR